MRTAPTGPEHGRPEIWVEIEAPLIATTSYASSGRTESTAATTCSSFRRPLTRSGRGGRSNRRQAGDLGGDRGAVDRDDVVCVVGVDREHCLDDLHLVAQAVDEERAQRAVDQAAGQDRLGRGTALATEERAGDLARGVLALLDV